jgi:outer membrane protein W
MKIKNSLCALILVGFLLLPTLSQARVTLGTVPEKSKRDNSGDEYFGSVVRYGAGLQFISFQPKSKSQFSSGSGTQFHFMMEYKTRYSIELSYGSFDVDVRETNKLGKGTAKVKPFLISVLYSFASNESSFAPYFLGGFGLYSVENPEQSVSSSIYVTQYGWDSHSATIKNGLGYHGGVGMKFYPAKKRNFSLDLDYRYMWVKPEVHFNLTFFGSTYGPYKTTVDLGGQLLRAGVSYYF